MKLTDILTQLCQSRGTSGDEGAPIKTAIELSGLSGRRDTLGNGIVFLGDPHAKEQVLLDAHMDQVGLIVTGIDEEGFLHIDRCGGADRRVLPGCPVTVFGKESLFGVIGNLPPHLSDGKSDAVPAITKMTVDLGLPAQKVKSLVTPGDRVIPQYEPQKLLKSRFASAALDNRAGAAILIRCIHLLKEETLSCGISVLFSTREEIGGQGAVTGSFGLSPTRAICVDVSFGDQPGVREEVSLPLGKGVMIGVAPVLDRSMYQKLASLADKKNIPYKWDVMGGDTGTNSDAIATTQGGVHTALLSVPLRYMHTACEVVDTDDLENAAQLMAAYLREVK